MYKYLKVQVLIGILVCKASKKVIYKDNFAIK